MTVAGVTQAGPIAGTSDRARGERDLPPADGFDALLAGYLGAVVAGGPVADPRDAAGDPPVGARRRRINQEVATMRAGELDRQPESPSPSDARGQRKDTHALRRTAQNAIAADRAPRRGEPGSSEPQSAGGRVAAEAKRLPAPGDGSRLEHVAARRISDSSPASTPSAAGEARSPRPAVESPAPQQSVRAGAASIAVGPASGASAGQTTAADRIARLLVRDVSSQPVRAGQPVGASQAADAAGHDVTRRDTADQNARGARASAEKAPTPRSAGGASARQTAFAKLVRMVRLNIGPRESSATIRMNPPELGRLRIDVRMDDNQLAVRVQADSETGRAMIAQRAGQLIDSLRAHDIFVRQLDIEVAGPRGDAATIPVTGPPPGLRHRAVGARKDTADEADGGRSETRRSRSPGGGSGLSVRA